MGVGICKCCQRFRIDDGKQPPAEPCPDCGRPLRAARIQDYLASRGIGHKGGESSSPPRRRPRANNTPST